ncbi:MAG: D-alanyl-D-alanine carboxypeptidase, partial [Paracoccaceae bacterium]|nr:D-alanyl-D-alanine carboxypeptidase [Paracoccaceae bacterium]
MSNTFSRRHFLTTAAAGLAFGAAAGAANAKAPLTSLRPAARGSDFLKDIQPPAEALIARAKLNGAVGFTVSDVSSGQMLEEYNGSMGLPPASVAKAMTAAYALHALGPGHHFVTEIVATRGVQNGVVAGDLVLKGGGDPTLDTNALAGLAAALKAAGIREVRGDFLVWGGALPAAKGIDDGQPDHVGYNPAVSGLNLNYNRVHF